MIDHNGLPWCPEALQYSLSSEHELASAILVPEFFNDAESVLDNLSTPVSNVENPSNNVEIGNTQNIISPSPLLLNDSPNSRPEPDAEPDQPPANYDLIHLWLTPPPFIDNQLVRFARQDQEYANSISCVTEERYFSVSGNIYQLGNDGFIRLHQLLWDDPYATTVPTQVILGQPFYIGLLPFFVDQMGKLYSVVDHPHQIKPKAVFATAVTARTALDLIQDGLSLSPGSSASGEFIIDGLGSPSSELGAFGVSAIDPTFLSFNHNTGLRMGDSSHCSPASSDSNGSVWSAGSIQSLFAPLFDEGQTSFSDLGAATLLESPVQSPCAAETTPVVDEPSLEMQPKTELRRSLLFPAPIPERVSATKTQIDEYVEYIKAMRVTRRGTKSGQIPTECPWCVWKNRRESHPSELKEHMYAHRGFNGNILSA
ncbi:hypothetical protein RhiJN_20170 [Ceratobasidium sp. AG-Ba]|nr:hypothetical protein RhiJN_20170 [Ceratobasidium sp. AG-Ba]